MPNAFSARAPDACRRRALVRRPTVAAPDYLNDGNV